MYFTSVTVLQLVKAELILTSPYRLHLSQQQQYTQHHQLLCTDSWKVTSPAVRYIKWSTESAVCASEMEKMGKLKYLRGVHHLSERTW